MGGKLRSLRRQIQREREKVEARQIILETRDVKLLADTVAAPKVKGHDQRGQPIFETFSTDSMRKKLEVEAEILKAIRPYVDEFDSLIEKAEADARQWKGKAEDNAETLETKQREINKINEKANEQIDALQKGSGRQEVALYLSQTHLEIVRGRFNDRDDLGGNKEMQKRLIAISDALLEANVKTIDVQPAKPAGDDRNGKPVLQLVKEEV